MNVSKLELGNYRDYVTQTSCLQLSETGVSQVSCVLKEDFENKRELVKKDVCNENNENLSPASYVPSFATQELREGKAGVSLEWILPETTISGQLWRHDRIFRRKIRKGSFLKFEREYLF